MIPGFGLIRKLLIPLVVIGAIVVGASIWVEGQVEQRVAVAAKERFGLSKQPKVDIGGGPVLLNIFNGTLPEVTMEAEDVRLRSLDVQRATLTLRDLSFDGSVLSAGDLSVNVAEGEAIATTGEDEVNELLRREKQDATVRLTENNVRVRMRRVVGTARRTIVADGRFSVRKSRLTFVPRQVTIDGEPPPRRLEAEAKRKARVSVKLPRLPGDFAVDEVSTGAGSVTFVSNIKDEKLTLSG